MCVCVCARACAQSLSVWFCDPMDHGPPGSSVCKNTGAGCHSLLQHDLSRNHVMPLLKSLQYLPISLREKPQFFRGEVPPAHRYSILLTIYPSLLRSPVCSPQLLPDVPLMSQSSTHHRAFAFACPLCLRCSSPRYPQTLPQFLEVSLHSNVTSSMRPSLTHIPKTAALS